GRGRASRGCRRYGRWTAPATGAAAGPPAGRAGPRSARARAGARPRASRHIASSWRQRYAAPPMLSTPGAMLLLRAMPFSPDTLKDRVALVTGASQGIGRAIAGGLAKAGRHVGRC